MLKSLTYLIDQMDRPQMTTSRVIKWGSPVPSFGDLTSARIATVGLNPSNREFVDELGLELDGPSRRFHSLHSLGLRSWTDADSTHLMGIEESCRDYFQFNPYGRWFDVLERVLLEAGASFYGQGMTACHLDLVPYATECKWTELSNQERRNLLEVAGDVLGLLLSESSISVLVLNGRTVVEHFRGVTGAELSCVEMSDWRLPRASGRPVTGLAYVGTLDSIGTLHLDREVQILGFNHNLQSSFGVTSEVISAIRRWVAARVSMAHP